MSKIVALITARGGSKGIPGKNLAIVRGKSLLAWTIEAALHSSTVSRTILSTEDDAILEEGRRVGAETPFIRPRELAEDHSTHVDVVLHALDALEQDPDWLLLLQPTTPMRDSIDIDEAVKLLTSDIDAVVSVCSVHPHPYLVHRLNERGELERYFPESGYQRRQELPPAYGLNGALYLIRPKVFRELKTFFPPRTIPYFMPSERSFDIDEPWDLHLIRLIMEDPAWQPRNPSR
jgi:CMP-N,N'-diacetyllegionaminic acid synthase